MTKFGNFYIIYNVPKISFSTKRESRCKEAVLGAIFLVIIIGFLFIKIGVHILSAMSGLIGILLGIATLIGLIILIACII